MSLWKWIVEHVVRGAVAVDGVQWRDCDAARRRQAAHDREKPPVAEVDARSYPGNGTNFR